MKVVYDLMPRMTLEEFGDKYGLTLTVAERTPEVVAMPHVGPGARFYAYFSGLEEKRGCILADVSGDGSTPDGAVSDYGRRISGRHLVVNAMSFNGRIDITPTHITGEDDG